MDMSLETLAKTIKKGPFLGMDWGKKRVGLAISDPDNTVALPLCVVAAGKRLRQTLTTLWQQYHVQALIVGWPLHLDGRESPLCLPIRRLAERLFHDHGWPLCFWDERLTSQAARRLCLSSPSLLDHHAASVLLKGALERWRHLI